MSLYKREFIEAVARDDYERAIDKLLKYTEVTGYPDFHLACGMLYLQMTQESDDRELLALAFREFMMHLSIRPDCKAAYRNLLAVMFLRRDPITVVEMGEFIKHRGLDLAEMISELSEVGIDMFTDDGSFIDFSELFSLEDYGEIGCKKPSENDAVRDDKNSENAADDHFVHKVGSRVIAFRGGKKSDNVKPNVKNTKDKISKLAEDPRILDGISDSDDQMNAGDMLELMMQMVKDEVEIDADGNNVFSNVAGDIDAAGEMRDRMFLRDAERACDTRDFDKALALLEKVGKDNERVYYCAECIRANIMSELKEYGKAQDALDRAYSIVPDGSLVGILQCRLYELTEKFALIPQTIKNIDVADYVDVDHAFGALMLAVKYCEQSDALELAEDYAIEFNSTDIRLTYAQLLYNAGERDEAIKELRKISRIMYDDFNVQYYYLSARSGVEYLPIEQEAPQNILGIMIDNLISIVNSDIYFKDSDLFVNEPFRFSLEVFLTLEFDNTRNVVKIMFDTLRILAADPRADEIMRNALVSPYVEPLVKAVILSERLKRGEREFLTEMSFCPIHSDFLPKLGAASDGVCEAYALVTVLCRSALKLVINNAKKLSALDPDKFGERDKANYLWRTVKSAIRFINKSVDGRIDYALGYQTKAAANAAYKKMCAALDEIYAAEKK